MEEEAAPEIEQQAGERVREPSRLPACAASPLEAGAGAAALHVAPVPPSSSGHKGEPWGGTASEQQSAGRKRPDRWSARACGFKGTLLAAPCAFPSLPIPASPLP